MVGDNKKKKKKTNDNHLSGFLLKIPVQRQWQQLNVALLQLVDSGSHNRGSIFIIVIVLWLSSQLWVYY